MMHKLFRRFFTVLLSMMSICPLWADGTYLSDLAVTSCYRKKNIGSAQSQMSNAGFRVNGTDVNKGCGVSSNYVYVGFKTTTDPRQAITLIAIISGTVNGNSEVKNVSFNGKKYDLKPAKHYYESNGDLNQNAGGSFLYLYYSTSHAGELDEHMYSDLWVSYDRSNGVPYYDVRNGALVQVAGVTNLNSGVGSGDNLFLIAPIHYHQLKYKKENERVHQHYCEACKLNKSENHSSTGNDAYRDNTYHWGKCKDCGEILGKQQHIFARSSTTGEEHSRVCSVCHVVINDKHKFGSFVPVDETQHMYVCSEHSCSYSQMLPHIWGDSVAIIVPATFEHDGIGERYCLDCHIAHRETIPQLASNSAFFRPDAEEDSLEDEFSENAFEDQEQEVLYNVYNLHGQCVMQQVTRSEAYRRMCIGEVYVINGKTVMRRF